MGRLLTVSLVNALIRNRQLTEITLCSYYYYFYLNINKLNAKYACGQ